jgi:hypothetical protein
MPAIQAKYARIWRGRTAREKADAYQRYWLDTGTAPLIARGAVAVQMLREDRQADTEFTTISWWHSIEEMAPGGDPYRVHHLPRDAEYLIELPERVQILMLLQSE